MLQLLLHLLQRRPKSTTAVAARLPTAAKALIWIVAARVVVAVSATGFVSGASIRRRYCYCCRRSDSYGRGGGRTVTAFLVDHKNCNHHYRNASSPAGAVVTRSSVTHTTVRRRSSSDSTTTATTVASMSDPQPPPPPQKLDSPSAERNKGPIWNVLASKVLPRLFGNDGPDAPPPRPVRILEVACGAGVHTQYFTQQLRGHSFRWYPTDADECLASTLAYRPAKDPDDLPMFDQVRTPRKLTLNENGIVEAETSRFLAAEGGDDFDLILNINMIHIAPWEATLGLMKVAGERLRRGGGMLVLYGPFKVGGTCVESNRYVQCTRNDRKIGLCSGSIPCSLWRISIFSVVYLQPTSHGSCVISHLYFFSNFDVSLRQRDPRWGVRDLESVMEVGEQNGLQLVETVSMPANNLMVLFQK